MVRSLSASALLAALFASNPAAAQDYFQFLGGGGFVGYAFGGERSAVVWGAEVFATHEFDRQFCSSGPRTVWGPLARLSLHNLARPALTLAAHAGKEQTRGLGLVGEAGITLGWVSDLDAPDWTPHTGVLAEAQLFNVFARQEWLLETYSFGGGVRLLPTFGELGMCVVGRPQRDVAGRQRLTTVRQAAFDTPGQALAADFATDADEEYEAVAAFLNLARDLAALGAPVDLVSRAVDAAGDELRHTALCSELATRFGADTRPRVPTILRRPPLRGRSGLARMAVESWLDGCLGEGLAAALAAELATTSTDAVVRETQRSIAADEQRHAELAWDVLQFCCHEDASIPALLASMDQVRVAPPHRSSLDARRRAFVARHHQHLARQRLFAQLPIA